MKKIMTLIISLLSINFLIAQTVWVMEPAHSSIQFEVPHLSISTVTGYFSSFSGTAITEGDDFREARINATIDVSSITTNNLERDKHLREDDFFNTKAYPNLSFKSTRFYKNEDGSYTLTGDLTIKDVTKPITLNANYKGILLIDNKKKAGFTAKGKVNRFDYGLTWDDVLDNGGLIVGEEVYITLNITFLQQQ